MQLDFLGAWNRPRPGKPDYFTIGSNRLPMAFVRNDRAKRYVLRLTRQGVVRVTVPRGGTLSFAGNFVEKNRSWLEEQWHKWQVSRETRSPWIDSTEILYRGEPVRLRVLTEGGLQVVQFVDQSFCVGADIGDVRAAVENHLWNVAAKELPLRTAQLASEHGVTYTKVMVRNQRSRWGSCSPSGTISLNWRLIQAPASVRDYLILHELMHRREMNHSARFWRLVETACPCYREAERWLNANADLLR